ncbi:hypothetical protein DB347_22655 [Opitutaceae bacterium EW11]|nr:hypothetical protein DB347_22655 [Opitutaceae bacterium EW11]
MRVLFLISAFLVACSGCVSVETEPVRARFVLRINGEPARDWQIAVLSIQRDGTVTRYGPWVLDENGVTSMEFPWEVRVRGHMLPKLEFPSFQLEFAEPRSASWYRVDPSALVRHGADLVCSVDQTGATWSPLAD